MATRKVSSIPVNDQADAFVNQSRLLRRIGYQLTRAELTIHRQLVDRFADFKLRPVEYSILVLVDDNPGINQRQLGDVLGVSPPNLVAVITRLGKRRLLRRNQGRQDRRVQHLYLTATGNRLLAEADAVAVQFDNDIAALLNQQETLMFAKALSKICSI